MSARCRALPMLLIDLAAGRRPGEPANVDSDLIRTASDHRMTGLLWSWARDNLDEGDERSWLAIRDLKMQAHLVKVSHLLERCVATLSDAGFDVATIKGVTAEQRWYDRRGERPCSDVDLLVAPDDRARFSEILATLQPDHLWIPQVDGLIARNRLQSITVVVDGTEVDIHVDLLKLGFSTRSAHELWSRTEMIKLPNGTSVRVLDETVALFHLLVHLNKDRFQRLLGYADIARLLQRDIDWTTLDRLARLEGIETSVRCTVDTVVDELGLERPEALPRTGRGLRAKTWHIVWRPSIRLLGAEGRIRFKRRQDWIALLARRRSLEAMRWWLKDLWPARVAVDTQYPDVNGPYLWKLAAGRIHGWKQRRRTLNELYATRSE